jgi:hypothetical protein
MIEKVPTEDIPVRYIEEWLRENIESGSALANYIAALIKDWGIEEIRIRKNWLQED